MRQVKIKKGEANRIEESKEDALKVFSESNPIFGEASISRLVSEAWKKVRM